MVHTDNSPPKSIINYTEQHSEKWLSRIPANGTETKSSEELRGPKIITISAITPEHVLLYLCMLLMISGHHTRRGERCFI